MVINSLKELESGDVQMDIQLTAEETRTLLQLGLNKAVMDLIEKESRQEGDAGLAQ